MLLPYRRWLYLNEVFMKKNIFACFALMISCAFAFSQTGDEKLLKLAEDRTAFYGTDFKGTYSIVQKIQN